MDGDKTNPEVDDTKKPGDVNNPEAKANKDGDKKPPAQSFTQDDLDAAVKKAVDAAKSDWDKQAKLKSLPEDEAAKEKFKQDREQFDKERAEFDKRVLETDAKDMLKEKGISSEFASMLIGKDAKETKANVEAFAEKWKADVSAGVDAQLKSDKPPKDHKAPPDDPFLSGFGL